MPIALERGVLSWHSVDARRPQQSYLVVDF